MNGWKVYTDQGGPCDPNSDTENCTRYGGFHNVNLCDSAFSGDPKAQKACNMGHAAEELISESTFNDMRYGGSEVHATVKLGLVR